MSSPSSEARSPTSSRSLPMTRPEFAHDPSEAGDDKMNTAQGARSMSSSARPIESNHAAKTAVCYLRVSTKEQAEMGGHAEGFSIPAQRLAANRQAESLEAVIVEEFVDAGESARSADRPELQRMLAY